MMTLDEAIKHCEEKSCGNSECANEHRQLSKWLKELKELKKIHKDMINNIPPELREKLKGKEDELEKAILALREFAKKDLGIIKEDE